MTGQKKKILFVSAIVLLLVLAVASIPLLLPLFDAPDDRRPINFADPSLSYYPQLDQEYMSLNRTVYFLQKGTTSIKTEITEDNVTQFSRPVRFLLTLIEAELAGDAAAYNALFSPEYIAASGQQAAFTPQKLYDIAIIEYSVSATAPEGYERVMLYGLAYKIKDNNGSLRTDVSSDAELEQYLTVVEDADGNLYIHGINVVIER